jgi:hypothetical protein
MPTSTPPTIRVNSATSNKLLADRDSTEAGHVAMHKNETHDTNRIIDPIVIESYRFTVL